MLESFAFPAREWNARHLDSWRLEEDRLTAQLRSSAAQFAQSGLRARLDQEWAVHQLHIATALELLAKAKLASLHGSLIAAKDFDSLLHLSGHPRHAKQPPDRIRTITITDALLRVGQVVPSIENLRSELKYGSLGIDVVRSTELGRTPRGSSRATGLR
jgi:hypothetical protein